MKRIQWKSFLMICFILVVIVIALMFHRNFMQQDNKLDTWLGGFKYEEIVPHPSGELNYYTDYYITIWKHHNQYYAAVEGSGWQLDTWELAYVSGDDKMIEIISLQTLPGDSMYGRHERYDKGEMLVRLERDGEKIITEWGGMDHHTEASDAVRGDFFQQVK